MPTCTGGVCGFDFTDPGTSCNDSGGTLCDGAGLCKICLTVSDCPAATTLCQVPFCGDLGCRFDSASPGTTCMDSGGKVCDGAGLCLGCLSESDCPSDPANPCQVAKCHNNACGVGPAPLGTSCSSVGGAICDGAGSCVGCVSASDCPDPQTLCQLPTCMSGTCGVTPAQPGTSCNDSNGKVCNSSGTCVACLSETQCPASTTLCQKATCTNGACGFAPTQSGTSCNDSNGKVCNGSGKCVACLSETQCPASTTLCQKATCTNGACGFTPTPSGTSCTDNNGKVCNGSGTCVACISATQCPPPPSVCMVATCSGGMCGAGPAPAGTPCQNGQGGTVCNATGQCVACLTSSDCANTVPACNGSFYTPPPTCVGGLCGTSLPVDCSLNGLQCTTAGCAGCTSDLQCGPATIGGCTTNACKSGVCKTVNAPQATACTGAVVGGAGPTGTLPVNDLSVCNANGVCIPGRYVFVTSVTFPPTFSGAQNADNKCQSIAQTVGLGGIKWMAWTSDGVTSPSMRFTQSTVPYMLLNDIIVANDWLGLTSGTLLHAIDFGENRMTVTQVPVWTGTNADGTPASASCNNWTTTAASAVLGLAGTTMSAWSNGTVGMCTVAAHLYCFQQQ